MTAAKQKFSPLGFYLSKRRRSELINLDDDRLRELVKFLPRKRLVTTFGSWRGKPAKPEGGGQ